MNTSTTRTGLSSATWSGTRGEGLPADGPGLRRSVSSPSHQRNCVMAASGRWPLAAMAAHPGEIGHAAGARPNSSAWMPPATSRLSMPAPAAPAMSVRRLSPIGEDAPPLGDAEQRAGSCHRPRGRACRASAPCRPAPRSARPARRRRCARRPLMDDDEIGVGADHRQVARRAPPAAPARNRATRPRPSPQGPVLRMNSASATASTRSRSRPSQHVDVALRADVIAAPARARRRTGRRAGADAARPPRPRTWTPSIEPARDADLGRCAPRPAPRAARRVRQQHDPLARRDSARSSASSTPGNGAMPSCTTPQRSRMKPS